MITKYDDEMRYYWEGVENEFCLDKDAMCRDGVDDTDFVVVRYMKLKMLIGNIKIAKLILTGVVNIWWLLHIVISIYCFFVLLNKKLFLTKETNKVEDTKKIFIISSMASLKNLKENFRGQQFKAIKFPWIKVGLDTPIEVLNFLSFLTYRDLVLILWKNIYVKKYYKSNLKAYNKSIILQTYHSYNWLAIYSALENIKPEEIWFVNHYDRWAIMFDRVTFILNKNQVQHGILNEDVKIVNKLKNIKKCYCLDDNSKKIFCLNYHLNKHTVYEIFKKYFETTKIYDGRQILFIGGPYDSNKELELINMIKVRFVDFLIIIKPHPVYSSKFYDSVVNGNVVLYKEKNIFPSVDIVISYQSTLGFEYHDKGIPVIFHDNIANEKIIAKLDFMIGFQEK
ncbi:hypothetical protein [Clostridium sp.]|uniref:hypothetical protein n=1 Tax=Clostridium sp. TaxID=1506 RepID=UPI001A459716|nr:hypothetical protein [Clostridium sp.]MBK5240785.1 hypothetical protein [Clostridium sp.]